PHSSFLYALFTFHLVAACWVLFRAQDFQIARDVFVQIFTNFHADVFTQWLTSYAGVAFLMFLGYALHFLPQSWSKITQGVVTRLPLPIQALLVVLVIWIVIQVKSADVQPFIYFQF
ncbi:MAG: MBOAT family protein, partial [Bacteroidaceae bacterium]|nr:MBOAT family protein [Bacteroidaceae bacterium]